MGLRGGIVTADWVASGQVAPLSQQGTCGTCQEPVVWCMAGYWVHEREDLYRDHAPELIDGSQRGDDV